MEAPVADPNDERREPPSVYELRVIRQNEVLRLGLGYLTSDPEASPLPLDPNPSDSESWTFQLSLDADQNPNTGAPGGADYAIMPVSPGLLSVWEASGESWSAIGEVAFVPGPEELSFSLSAATLDGDDGHMDYVLDVYRLTPVAGQPVDELVTRIVGSSNRIMGEASQVPIVTRLRTHIRGDSLVLRAQFVPPVRHREPFYDPEHAGGWMLQLFLNTDQSDTGYWLGYDYLARGGELLPDDSIVMRQITLDDTYPGGWGPASGAAGFQLRPRTLWIAVPLSSIGGDDGHCDFVLETYATVPCPECPGGFTQVFQADYFGSTDRSREHPQPVAFAPLPRADIFYGSSPRMHGTRADRVALISAAPGR